MTRRDAPRFRRWRIAAIAIAGMTFALAAHRPSSDAAILYNDSPSVPCGFWVRTSTSVTRVRVGEVIAFRPPATADAYLRKAMPEYLHRQSIIKYVAALPGDKICRKGRRFSVNGRMLGSAFVRDDNGRRLPTWTGCDTLTNRQLAVFSARIPNSFDSRYYGPVPTQNVLGVYRPLLTW